MASALASQLQELARQRQPALPATLKGKGKPSLLFDFQKAADVDLHTIYGIACQGLEDLIRLELSFRPYRESLFSRASLDINPELQTTDFLAKLDESITSFCFLLSNHFLAPAAFKALEYLIRRYKANERNVDALLTAALPYHATNEFVRLVQTLAIGVPGSLWGWLAKMQSSGAALPRDLLAQRCANDRQLLLFVCKAAGQLGGASDSGLRAHSRTFLSFYAVLLCEVLAVLSSIGEDTLALLLPHLLGGLGRGAAQDYRAATLMAVAELCSRATLGRDFIKVLLNTMLKHTEPVAEHVRTALLVLAHVAVTQPHVKTLSDKTLKHLSELPNAVSEIASLAQRGNIRLSPLLLLLARSLASTLVAAGGAAGGSAGRRCEADLLSLAHTGSLRGEPAGALAGALLAAGGAAKVDAGARTICQKLLRVLDQRYPETTDAAVNSYLEPLRDHRRQAAASTATVTATATITAPADANGQRKRRKTAHGGKAGSGAGALGSDDDDEDVIEAGAPESADAAAAGLSVEDRARFDFVRETFSAVGGCYSSPCGGTMLTLAAALAAPQAAVRRMALQQLDFELAATAAAATSGAAAGSGADASAAASGLGDAQAALAAAALARLQDDDLGVVVAALGLTCLHRLPPAALLGALQPLALRLGEHLYGSARLPQLKAARRAARKVAALLGHVGAASTAACREAAALQLAALMLPSHRDPRVALEAARAAAGLDEPLFAGLVGALPALEALLQPAGAAAPDAGKAKGGKGKGKTALAAADAPVAAATKGGKKAEARAAAAALERGVVAALAKALAADPAARLPEAMRLVAASAAAGAAADSGAGAASLRAQHLVLLVARAAASAAKGKAAPALAHGAVQLAEALLPYARVAASGDQDWLAAFADQVSPQDGLPTPAHAAALLADPVAAHGALILGVLRASLADLPEAAPGSDPAASAASAAASRSLGMLASLESPLDRLGDLPLLVITRAVEPASRSAFLARHYASPGSAEGSVPASVQRLALLVQAQLAATGGSGRHAAVVDASGWLVSVLAALAAEDAGVRAAACDCLAALLPLLQGGKAAAGPALPLAAAAALCSGLLAQRGALCRDADALHSLLRAALQGSVSAASAAAAPPPTPSKSKKGAAATAAAAASPKGPLDLPTEAAAATAAYLTSCLRTLATDAAGVNAACTALACLLPTDSLSAASTTTSAPQQPPAAAPELFAAGCAYLARLVARLQDEPSSAMPLHAHAAQQLLRLYFPAAASSAAAAGHEDQLGHIAEAAELLPPPPPASSAAPAAPLALAAAAALAATRLAAVASVTPELFGALPPACRTVRELFVVLLARSEGDPDDRVRAAARAALEAVPLSADLILPLLDPHAPPPPAAAAAAATPAKKKAKKSESAAATPGPAAAEAHVPAAAAAAPLLPAALRDAVVALELLQWRTGVLRPQLLVGALQALLLRLLPHVGSLADSTRADAEGGDADEDASAATAAADAAEEGGRSSLAGYAAMLALTALTALAGPGEAEMASSPFDVELAVRAAREAPDAAVRNAALGLLAALATRAPEAALSHVLQVLAVVNQSAALHDDDHSRAVAGTALAAVVPAWVAAGHRSTSPLWVQVVAALGSLPPQRRLDLLLALMRALPQAEEGLSEGLLVLLQHAIDPPAQPPAAQPPTPAPLPRAKAPKSAKKARVGSAAVEPAAAAAPAVLAGPPPSEWLPELASQLALQAELPVRLACCARVLEAALDASDRKPHTALPRTVVAFVVAQLKMKAAVAAASASLRRPDADPALEAACRRLMSAALASMQLLQPDVATAASKRSSSASPAPAPAVPSRHLAVLAATRGLYGMFAALQGVMSADTYLQALLTLAEHPSDKVKRRAIKLFTDKVRGVRSELADHVELPQRVRDAKLRQAADAAARACAMLPPLLAAPLRPEGCADKGADAGAGAGASPLTRQLALVALSAIAAEFGATQHAALLAGVHSVLAATRDAHASIRASALATVAAFVRALGSKLVPVLPSTVAAAVAAANAAWARLSLTGGVAAAAAKPDASPASGSDDESDAEEEDDEEVEGAVPARRRLRAGADEEDAALELSSALACLNALVETLGGFLSPHLPSVLSILLNPRVLACRTSGCDSFAAAIRNRLPTVVPARLLLPALYDKLQPCIDAAADAADAAAAAAPAAALLQMVAAAVTAMEPKVAAQYHEQLFAFLLRALDVRQRQPPPLAAHGEAAVSAVEAAAVRALVALVMKLSEARFRPLFLRMLEWASTVSVPEGGGGEPTYLGRMAALFAAVNALSDRLRSVLVPYYRYLLEVIVQHLGEGLAGAAGGRPRGKKKLRKSAAAAAEEDGEGDAAALAQQRLSWLLRLRMVRALHRCFSHDSVGFTDAERFARLQPVLIEQLAVEPPPAVVPFLLAPHHADRDLDSYLSLGAATKTYTAPDGAEACGPLGAASVGCLLAMAVAANSDALWKPLNHAALMLTRSGSPRTRALALEVAAQLVERLREEYLVLLPETLPFMSELLEDGDAGVAERVRQVVKQLEEISGEKLDEYLTV
ncbi:hypothetical protein TSOC_007476 [Tetrabaena socialis]|uniref:BP28 C-terminal domain-containing protein n=1 Tax=Tetrabaena socialis TaxID=47790 RepID=A0A2J8A0W1_9CHLO|nr:hypothetical protein TSOC_007476 [Tetrabaena socialis]|eukprot:PNH06163.1 hypothetical protein TSOC_007476 [Tetrabaena socialis]